MATRQIASIITLKDKMSKPLFGISKKMQGMSRQQQNMARQNAIMAQKMAKNFTKIGDKVVKTGLAFVAAGAAAASAFAKKSIDAAQVQLENELKLTTILKERTNATDAQMKSIFKLTSAQQANGVVGDEVQLAGAQQLATFVTQTSSIKSLIPAMNNLLVQQKGLKGTTGDAVNIGNLMGKVLQGQTGALKKVGITFSKAEEKVLKFGTEEERSAMLAKVITNNVGEMNKAMSKTDAGAIQQAKNLFGDMQEEVGKKLLPYLGEFAKWFSDNFPQIQEHVLRFTDVAVESIKKVYEKLKLMYDWFMKNREIIETVAIVFGSFYAAIKIVGALAFVIEGLTFVMGLLNGTLALTPIGWIVIAIAGLIAAGVLLWKNWDKIVEKGKEMKQDLIDTWNSLIEFFKHPIKAVVEFSKKGVTLEDNKALNMVKGFARGGIARKPSVFGEAGPEIAIPLNNSNRSQSLLAQANQMLGKTSSLPKLRGNTTQPMDNGITVIVQGNVYGEEDFVNRVGKAIVEKTKTSRMNLSPQPV